MRRRLPLRHETDMRKYLGDVRCWVNSGKHLLSLSFSDAGPLRAAPPSWGRDPKTFTHRKLCQFKGNL